MTTEMTKTELKVWTAPVLDTVQIEETAGSNPAGIPECFVPIADGIDPPVGCPAS